MAASKGHVDANIAERRLRPIYDYLDNGNNKKALQEAEKVLKKQPNFQCARVLKALALLRMGKNEESETIVENVKNEIPTDDATLQALAICYREVHQTDKICDIYSAAVAKNPDNEELLSHLFMAYVRVGDFKSQQRTAMTLYKLKPKNPYYFWGVMSVVMQAREVSEETARSVILPLAERMVVMMRDKGKMEAEQEVQLYLMILEMQDKIEEALQVLDGPLGEILKTNIGYLKNKKAALLSRIGRWEEAHLLYKNMIQSEQDRWNYYCEYMRTAFKLWAIKPDETELDQDINNSDIIWCKPDSTPKDCASFLNFILNEHQRIVDKTQRAPFLAKLELYKRLVENPQPDTDPEKLLGDLVELINIYFVPFGAKPCCFSDLKSFLPLLPSERGEELMTLLKKSLDIPFDELPINLTQLRRHVNLIQMTRYLGLQENISVEEKENFVTYCLKHYDHGSQLETELIPTDFPFSDPYVHIACNMLVELAIKNGQHHRLLEAATILEHSLTLSPSNFHLLLLLLRIYSLAGAGGAAQSTFESIDIKHIQLDSLGWIHCAHLSSTAHIAIASAHYEATLKFFTSNYKDSVDHLTFSYKYGSFLKISEFVEFRDRLHSSHHYTRCTVERMLTELMTASSHDHAFQSIKKMDVTPAEDTIEWDKLRDNRDLDIVISHDPPYRQISNEIKESTFKREIALLKLRSYQLRCLAAAYELLNPNSNIINGGEYTNNISGEGNLLSTLITQLLHFYFPPIPTCKSQINHPIATRAESLVNSSHISAFVAGLKLANQLYEFCQDPQADPVPVLESMVQVLKHVLEAEKAAEELLDNDNTLITRRAAIESAVNSAETLSFMALLCGIYQSLVKPSGGGKKGKKKRDNVKNTQSQVLNGLEELASRLRGVCEQLSDCVGRWESRVALMDEAAELMGKWTLNEVSELKDGKKRSRVEVSEAVSAKLRHSYMASAKELQIILTLKIKHFQQFTTVATDRSLNSQISLQTK